MKKIWLPFFLQKQTQRVPRIQGFKAKGLVFIAIFYYYSFVYKESKRTRKKAKKQWNFFFPGLGWRRKFLQFPYVLFYNDLWLVMVSFCHWFCRTSLFPYFLSVWKGCFSRWGRDGCRFWIFFWVYNGSDTKK